MNGVYRFSVELDCTSSTENSDRHRHIIINEIRH